MQLFCLDPKNLKRNVSSSYTQRETESWENDVFLLPMPQRFPFQSHKAFSCSLNHGKPVGRPKPIPQGVPSRYSALWGMERLVGKGVMEWGERR